MEYIPDPIEIGENRFEDYLYKHSRGDEMQCLGCKKWYPMNSNEWVDISPDPNAIPACRECVEKDESNDS